MKIAAWTNPSGSAYWRLIDPFKYLDKTEYDARIIHGPITEEVAQWADTYIVQQCVHMEGLALLIGLAKEQGKKLIVEHDDAIAVSNDNPFKLDHDALKAREILTITMQNANMITCTVPFLGKKLARLCSNVQVLPNFMDFDRWLLPTLPNTTGRIRIGWLGSITHWEDMKSIAPALNKILGKHPDVQLVLVGDPRFRELFPNHERQVETRYGVQFEAYPSLLHGLRLDIGIAPLVVNTFNKCKSDIKLQEYASCGIPIVATDMENYTHSKIPALLCVDNDEWVSALDEYIGDAQLRAKDGKANYQALLKHYNLKENIGLWNEAYKMLY